MLVSILIADASIYANALFQDSLGEKDKVEKLLRFHYLICMLLPVLKRMNQDQSFELETEATTEGSDDDSPLIDVLCITLLFNRRNFFFFMMSLCVTGKKPSEVYIKQAEFGCNEKNCWYVIFFLKVLISLLKFN
jgi:hypothetical protein